MKYTIILSFASLILTLGNIAATLNYVNEHPTAPAVQETFWTIRDSSQDKFYFSKGKPVKENDDSFSHSYNFINALDDMPAHITDSAFMQQISYNPVAKQLEYDRVQAEKTKELQDTYQHMWSRQDFYINTNSAPYPYTLQSK